LQKNAFRGCRRRLRLQSGREQMDAIKFIEEYEANHAKDDYTTDLEMMLDGLSEEMLSSTTRQPTTSFATDGSDEF
jgi:hypothetical protein